MHHLSKGTTAVLFAVSVSACHHAARDPEPAPVAMARADTVVTYSSGGSVSPGTYTDTSNTSNMSSSMGLTSRSTSASGARAGRGGAATERREVLTAIRTLDRAKYALEHASHEYGGHRTGALKAVDGALVELRRASGQEARAQTARVERTEDKEIHQAVIDLERARRDMETAKHDFGGRKTETLKAVDAALAELRLAAENEK